jgi:hypothetical protein
MKIGDKVLREIVVRGSSTISPTVYTLIEHEGAAHTIEDHPDADPSPYPYDLATGREVGNPMAAMGITSRVILLDGQ